jgi:sugar phosphate permease
MEIEDKQEGESPSRVVPNEPEQLNENSAEIEIPIKSSKFKQYSFQALQIFTFFSVYGSSYLAIGVLSVATPLLIKSNTFTFSQISTIIITSKMIRFFPKLLSGTFVDIFGGKLMYTLSHFSVSIIMCLIYFKPYSHHYYWFLILFVIQNIATTVSW